MIVLKMTGLFLALSFVAPERQGIQKDPFYFPQRIMVIAKGSIAYCRIHRVLVNEIFDIPIRGG